MRPWPQRARVTTSLLMLLNMACGVASFARSSSAQMIRITRNAVVGHRRYCQVPPTRATLPAPAYITRKSVRAVSPRLYSSAGHDGVESNATQPLLLNPKAPLSSLLSGDEEDHLSRYTLPSTVIGVDDYRVNLKKGQRVVAFGDVHGDIKALRSFLETAGILDPESTNEEPIWSGGNTICVQTGDVLDRGDDELLCYRLLATLSRQAEKAGGSLILLYGNHESLNAAGLFQYANPGGNKEFEDTIGKRIDYNYGSNRWRLQFAGNEPCRWASFEPGGLLADNMLQNMFVACVVGRTVFVHAGLTVSHLSGGNSVNEDTGEKIYSGISRMNSEAREWILTAHHGDNNNWGDFESVEQVIAAAQNRAKVASKTMPDCLGGGIGASSPVWMRDYSQPNDQEPKNPMAKKMIAGALKESGRDVQRMVMGHTPQHQINSALEGMAWRIDVGASQGVMGGTPEVLEIIHKGADDDSDIINILTVDEKRVEGGERAVFDRSVVDFFDMRR
mmetsp:Transcript_35164/g.83991  ORF Transcript_35164/g.83991 Transcript_35164/m.83991 type:complete len:504 (+) Transcript_35164:115-1626(+)